MNTEQDRYLRPGLDRLLQAERRMALVAGPRQVGKTTLARRLLAERGMEPLYFNWDIESHRKLLVRHPGDFWQRVAAPRSGGRLRIVLDEIHKYPRWKRFLKGLQDEHGSSLEIVVTGSGRLDLYQRGGDSLFGRYHLHRLHPFTLGEMVEGGGRGVRTPAEFWQDLGRRGAHREAESLLADLERFTGFPEPLFAGSERVLQRWRRAHRELVLREDLRDLTRIREIGLVDTLAILLPERVGSPLSINALREDLGVNFASVKGWLEAMARLYYLFTLRPYAGRLARTLRSAEKVYLYDSTGIGNPGARFENLVALHLRKLVDAWADAGEGEYALWYVRDREKREADFLITESRKPYALIEAKLSSRDPDPGLRYFAERLKPRYTVQVVRNPDGFTRSITSSGVLLTPAAEFLALM